MLLMKKSLSLTEFFFGYRYFNKKMEPIVTSNKFLLMKSEDQEMKILGLKSLAMNCGQIAWQSGVLIFGASKSFHYSCT